MSTPLFPRRVGRRTLLKQGAGLLAAPLVMTSKTVGAAGGAVRQLPPSDRITVGVIGLGSMGGGHFRRLIRNPQVQVLAASDVDQWRLNNAKTGAEEAYGAGERSGRYRGFVAYSDFRELMARPDIDAVLIATGERWHAVMTVMAAKAGKDVYVEKPISFSIQESRAMIDVIRKHNRVFQAGLQQRSTFEFRTAVELVRNGRIGRVKNIYTNWTGGSVPMNLPAEPVPPTLDWEMFVGPSAWTPFNNQYHQLGPPKSVIPWSNNINLGGGSILHNGVHPFDIAQWGLGMDESGPVEVIPPSKGTPEVMTFKYASGVVLQVCPRRLNPATQAIPEGFDPATNLQWEVLFVGEHGWIMPGRNGRLDAYPKEILADAPRIGPAAAAADTVLERLNRDTSVATHHDNWLQSIRMRHRATSDVESSARATNIGHLANIGYRTDRKLTWDPAAEAFVGDDEANRMRSRTLRGSWELS